MLHVLVTVQIVTLQGLVQIVLQDIILILLPLPVLLVQATVLVAMLPDAHPALLDFFLLLINKCVSLLALQSTTKVALAAFLVMPHVLPVILNWNAHPV